jgi:hypothetical protein
VRSCAKIARIEGCRLRGGRKNLGSRAFYELPGRLFSLSDSSAPRSRRRNPSDDNGNEDHTRRRRGPTENDVMAQCGTLSGRYLRCCLRWLDGKWHRFDGNHVTAGLANARCTPDECGEFLDLVARSGHDPHIRFDAVEHHGNVESAYGTGTDHAFLGYVVDFVVASV